MSEALKPWFGVATPHEDIREGRLDEAVFAANIWAVVQGTAPGVYLDPEEFFQKTYMTLGLETILKRVAGALQGGGDSGDRVISLQTAFGGGKTHTLVALWHLARHGKILAKSKRCPDVRRVLNGRFPGQVRSVAVFTNATCDATQGRLTPEGIRTHSLWGELAVQLGGKALYDNVRANDESQRVPQGLFVDILKSAAPCLILLDELADYCVGAAAVPVGETTLADQTISFVQQLTEAVQQVSGAVVVATLPASKFEVAHSEKGQEAFVTLERRFQRLGADVKPVADNEIHAVVRARLFEAIAPAGTPDEPRHVAEAFHRFYSAHSAELPADVLKAAYRDEIERAYPFHPVIIDALYTRWGSHPDFQRTRGVLRLLASLVGDLWSRRATATASQPLIQPCHIRWSIDALQAALTRLWGPAYQSVAAADIVGDKSNAASLDEERGGDYRREEIAQGLAAAALLGSFGGQGQRSGFSSKDLKLACSRPGLNWAYTDGALLELENRCFYLHSTSAGNHGKRYWFATKPTLNKLVVQYRQQAAREDFDADIVEQLRDDAKRAGSNGGATWRTIVDPEQDLPEQKAITLLVLPPSVSWGDDDPGQEAARQLVLRLATRCGDQERAYKNTLLFLAGTSRGLARLRTAFRERAALLGVQNDYSTQLDDEQRVDLKKRIDAAEKTAAEAAGPAYTVALRVQGQSVLVAKLQDARSPFAEHLGYLWTTLVEDEEWIIRRAGGVTLKQAGLIPDSGGIRVKDAVDAFLRFTDKPIIASKAAVTDGLAQACRDGLIGIGRGASHSNLQSRQDREMPALDPTEEGLWIIPPTSAQPSTEAISQGPASPGTDEAAVTRTQAPPATAAGSLPGQGAAAAKPVTRVTIKGRVPVESWSDVFRSFVGPAARMQLRHLKLGIDFELEPDPAKPLQAGDTRLESIREAARQLGLEVEESSD
jgi:hypothetical protein